MREYGRQGANGHDYSQGISENGIFNGIMPWMQSLWDDIFGYNSQQREFEQQEYLLEKEQDWSSEQARMQRMRQAGINPMTAAAGIAGAASSPTAPQVSNSGAQGAAGLGSIGNLISSITGGVKSIAEAKTEDLTRMPVVDKIVSETGLNLEKIGTESANRQAAENYLKYMDEDQFTNLQIKRVNLRRLNQEFKNQKAQHDLILSQITLTDEQYELIKVQEGEVAANTAKINAEKSRINEETRYQKWINDWCETNNIRPSSNTLDAITLDLWLSGGDVDAFYDTFSDGAHKISVANYNADPFNKKYNEAYTEMNRLYNMGLETDNLIDQLETAFNEGKVSSADYKENREKLDKLKSDIEHSQKELSKAVAKLDYASGHSSYLQSVTKDLVKIGVVVGNKK